MRTRINRLLFTAATLFAIAGAASPAMARSEPASIGAVDPLTDSQCWIHWNQQGYMVVSGASSCGSGNVYHNLILPLVYDNAYSPSPQINTSVSNCNYPVICAGHGSGWDGSLYWGSWASTSGAGVQHFNAPSFPAPGFGGAIVYCQVPQGAAILSMTY